MSKEQKDTAAPQSDKAKKTIGINAYSYFKVILVLAIIIGIIYFIAQFLRKYLKIKGEFGEGVNIIINQSLGAGKWIQVVYIAGKFMILGVTNDNISLLSEVKEKEEIERLELLMNEKKTEDGTNFVDTISSFLKDKFKTKMKKEKFDYEVDTLDFLSRQKERINKLNKNGDE